MSTKNYRSSGKARVLLSLLSDPAGIVDAKGCFLIVNDVFEEITGLRQRDLVGKTFSEVSMLTAESKTILLESLTKEMQGAPAEPYEVYFASKAGENKCFEVKRKKISFAGQPANLFVFHEVTRRKENAKRLKEYSERMEKLVEDKDKEVKISVAKLRGITNSAFDAMFIFDEAD